MSSSPANNNRENTGSLNRLDKVDMTEHSGRSRSLDRSDRGRRRIRQFNGERRAGTLPADMRRTTKEPDFSTLPRGFTLNGRPILPREQVKLQQEEEEVAWLWWSLYIFILGLAVANLIVTFIIIRLMGLGLYGSPHVEVDYSRDELNFWNNLYLDQLIHRGGEISGYRDESLQMICPEGKEISVRGYGLSGPQVQIDQHHVNISNVHDFNVKEPVTGKVLFSTSDPTWTVPEEMSSLGVEEAEVGKGGIVSPLNSDLRVTNNDTINLSGSEGVLVEGGRLVLAAEDHITIGSRASNIQIKSEVFINAVLQPIGGGTRQVEAAQFKVCACKSTGILFKVRIPRQMNQYTFGCHMVESNHPCRRY